MIATPNGMLGRSSRSSMNRILSIALPFLLSICVTRAESPIFIDLSTDGAATRYTMNNQLMTDAELKKWIKATVAQFGDSDPVIIRPNPQTTFKTVFDLLQALRTAGIKRLEVRAESEITKTVDLGNNRILATEVHRGIHLAPDNLKESQETSEWVIPRVK